MQFYPTSMGMEYLLELRKAPTKLDIPMKESFLHFIWRYRRIEEKVLFTTERAPLQIIDGGEYNTNAGPDFLQAKIDIGDTRWLGHVEVHIKSSDWYRHKHQDDPAYNNVILHVVWEEDVPVKLSDGSRIPCLELKPITTPQLFQSYKKLAHHQGSIPCESFLNDIPVVTKSLWLDRLVVERLHQKIKYWEQVLIHQNNDWEQVFFQALARNLGLPVNKEAMEQLAKSTPWTLLKKNGAQLFQIEALLFGQAGMLEAEFEEDYPRSLQKEYEFLQHKYQLKAMPSLVWKFSRMRPSNFPSIRIAQLARLVFQSHHLFSKLLAMQQPQDAYNMLDIKIAQYWKNHYRFDQISEKNSVKQLGKATIDLILINTLIPFLFLYGKQKDLLEIKEKALDFLEQITAENNTIIRDWSKRGFLANTAYESQALIQLYQAYCKPKRCLECAIGVCILKA